MTPRYGRGLVVALESRGQLNPGPVLTPYLATLTLLIRTQAAPLARPTAIRANQGHSVTVDLQLEQVARPRAHYDGMDERSVETTRASGPLR
jgi:hypothetical protein